MKLIISPCKKTECRNPVERDGFCNIHYWHHVWLDNTDRKNLGIVKFGLMLVPTWLRNDVPEFHIDAYIKFLGLYSPALRDKYDRLLAEIAFRGGAKTTRAKLILLYICCFGLEPFVVYCSETNTFATQDVFEVKRELSTNPHIRQYFGEISSRAVMGQDGEWTRDAYLTSTGVYVLARGVGQQVRSALRNAWRPTLAIINDMDSKNTIKTEYSRENQQKWFFNDLFNAVDDLDGKVYFNGTILHEDTVPVVLESNPQWKTMKTPVMDIDDFHRVLREHCTVTEREIILPSDERIDELQKSCKMAWQERLDLRYILRKYAEAYASGQAPGFYQEYFHVIVPPDEKSFRSVKRAKMTFFKSKGYKWLTVEYDGGKEVTYQVNTFAGVDPASATTQTSKFSAIVVIAMNKDRQVFVYAYSRGKFGFRDQFTDGYSKQTQSDIVELDKSNIARVGIVDEEIRLAKQFSLNGAKVETVQQQQSVYDEILRIMSKNNCYHRLFDEKPVTEKTERDADLILPYIQTGSLFLNYGLADLEKEMDTFPKGSTIDLIDALAYAVSIVRPPEGLDFDEIKTGRFKKKEEDLSFVAL